MEWMNNPALQSSVIPLIISLLFTWLLRRFVPYYASFGILAGFLAASLVTSGVIVYAWNTTTRIYLVLLLCLLCLPVLERRMRVAWQHRLIVVFLTVAGFVFVFFGIFAHMSPGALMLWLAVGAVYTGMISESFTAMADRQPTQYVTVLVLAMVTGLTALITGSALIMQLNFAMAAACGGYLLWLMFAPANQPVSAVTVPVLAGLVCGYTAFSKLVLEDGWPLLPLLCIVFLVRAFTPSGLRRWPQAFIALGLALPGAVACVIYLLATQDSSLPY